MRTCALIIGIAASLSLFTGCAAFDQALTQPYQQQPTAYGQAIQPNAYGLGMGADQNGRPQTYYLQDGQQLSPIFQGGVQQNAYGLGVGMDQFGRPVYSGPP
ncbi:MAG: hypothetical protein P4L87_00925 [Formivibrio sp.]|nr:hypothetical protein [Formivibrio sp.]